MQENATRTHLTWVDVTRFSAIFLVVCCHCCDPFNCSPDSRGNELFNYWGSFYGSFLRPCVPLFAMMTGLLILPIRNMSTSVFYRKRLLRILSPFLIWSVLYNLFPSIVGSLGGSEKLVTTFFPYAGFSDAPDLSWGDTLNRLLIIPFQFSVYDVHMWYIYMLIGLYLFMPILSAWLEKASRRDLEFYLVLWGVTLFFPYVYQYVSNYFWGTCSWNSFGTLYYFAGFNGYLLLGYYLNKYNTLSLGKSTLIALPLFAIGYYVTLTGFRSVTADANAPEEMIELFWTYCSPNVVLMTIACFILLQKVQIKSETVRKRLSKIGTYGLGLYMCHYFFVGVAYMAIRYLGVPVQFQIPVTAVIVMALAWCFTAAVYRLLPKQARWIMG